MATNQPQSKTRNWTTTYLGNQVPSSNASLPISSTDSFVVLPSGEVLPLSSNLLSPSAENGAGSGRGGRRRVTFEDPQATSSTGGLLASIRDGNRHEVDDILHFHDEEADFPTDAEDEEELGETDGFEEEEEDDEADGVPDDEPSTSSGVRRDSSKRPGYHKPVNSRSLITEATKAALMSTETQDLLEEMRSAYGKGKRRKRRAPQEIDDDGESQEIEDDDNDQGLGASFDDPCDEEYFPQENMRRRARAKRRLPGDGDGRRSGKKRRVASKTTSTVSKRSGAAEITDYSDWTEAEEGGLRAADGACSETEGTTRRKKKQTASKKPSLARIERLAWNDFLLSDDDFNDAASAKKRYRAPRNLPPEVQSLLGQANVSFAQGRCEEALKMVEEVVRLHPNYYESYDVLSMFHGVMGHKDRQLQFGLLAAHLNGSCDAEKWAELADLAVELGERDQAILCYTKAHRVKPTMWEYYDSKIKLLEKSLEGVDSKSDAVKSILKKIADTKLAAVKGLVANVDQFSTDEYIAFAKKIFQEFYDSNDARGSISCLKWILERAKADGGRVLYEYLSNLVVVAMHAKDYEAALLAVFRYSKLQAHNSHGEVNLSEDRFAERIERHSAARPLTSEGSENLFITHYIVPQGFNVDLMGRTITCWIRLKRYDCCERLLEMLQAEVSVPSAPDIYWEIAEALADIGYHKESEKLLEQLVRTSEYDRSTAVWLCYAEVLSSQGKLEAASMAFGRVVQLSPRHVSARLSLSALQQQFGQVEEALQTLDIGGGCSLEPERLDERLLYQRCILLRQQESWSQFITTGRFLMAMYFKDTYSYSAWNVASAIRYGGWKVSMTLRGVVLEAIRETYWERLVKRMPHVEADTVPIDEIWDVFFQLCELMFERRMVTDLFYICCFASQCPIFLRGSHMRIVLNLLLFASLLRRNAKVAWTLLRYCLPANNSNAAWNVHGLLFVFSQEVRYHRFTLRAMLRIPESVPLAWLSGNNSLISGTYQHALAEYYYILKLKPNDPLLNLLCGLCNLHLATKKFIARRHDLFIQGLAFLCKYEELRGPCQEVYYNIGRALQQTGVLYAAVHYYQKALAMEPMAKGRGQDEDEADHKGVGQSLYDLRPLVAHNLGLIYQNSNNTLMARELLERYCTIE